MSVGSNFNKWFEKHKNTIAIRKWMKEMREEDFSDDDIKFNLVMKFTLEREMRKRAELR